jgi:hypothetical protein
LDVIDQALDRRQATRRQLEHKIPQVKQRVLSLFGEAAAVESDPDADPDAETADVGSAT